jgi:hypothetical protein
VLRDIKAGIIVSPFIAASINEFLTSVLREYNEHAKQAAEERALKKETEGKGVEKVA